MVCVSIRSRARRIVARLPGRKTLSLRRISCAARRNDLRSASAHSDSSRRNAGGFRRLSMREMKTKRMRFAAPSKRMSPRVCADGPWKYRLAIGEPIKRIVPPAISGTGAWGNGKRNGADRCPRDAALQQTAEPKECHPNPRCRRHWLTEDTAKRRAPTANKRPRHGLLETWEELNDYSWSSRRVTLMSRIILRSCRGERCVSRPPRRSSLLPAHPASGRETSCVAALCGSSPHGQPSRVAWHSRPGVCLAQSCASCKDCFASRSRSVRAARRCTHHLTHKCHGQWVSATGAGPISTDIAGDSIARADESGGAQVPLTVKVSSIVNPKGSLPVVPGRI